MSQDQDQEIGKRARQKANREAQRAQERARQARARRNRMFAFSAAVVLVVAGIGLLVQRQFAARAAQEAERAAVAAKLVTLGCTPDTAQPDLGGGNHLEVQGPENVAANPPQVVYQDRPATSGPHVGSVVKTGVYDTLIDERVLVHNLEHGYVIAYYMPSAPRDQVSALKEWGAAQIDGDFPKTIVAPWTGEPLADGAQFAFTAWNFRQMCAQFDPQVASVFAAAHSGSNSRAPESSLLPHLNEQPGAIFNPTDENLLLPPLDRQPAS